MLNSRKNIIFSSSLIIALVASLGLIVYLQQKIFNFNQVATNSGVTITNLNYDPFVVTVPKEYVALHARSKIFINTMDPYTGNLGAPVVIVSFLSFNQIESQTAYQLIKALQEKYPEQVVWFWKDYPLDDTAKNMAVKAQCAQEYDQQFWETADKLFSAAGNSAGDTYSTCLETGEMADIVNSNYYYGRSLGVTNAPAIFINDQEFNETLTLENLEQKVQNEINSKN